MIFQEYFHPTTYMLLQYLITSNFKQILKLYFDSSLKKKLLLMDVGLNQIIINQFIINSFKCIFLFKKKKKRK
jgi:hypothetical protein